MSDLDRAIKILRRTQARRGRVSKTMRNHLAALIAFIERHRDRFQGDRRL